MPTPIGTFGGMLTLVSVADGNGDSYSIGTNQDQVYKFYTQRDSDPLFSPGSLTYNLYDVARATTWPLTDYTSEISLIGQESQIDEIWALLERLNGYTLDVQNPQIVNLLEAVQDKDTDARTITFNFAELFGYKVDNTAALDNDPADVTAFNALKALITEENCCILIETFQSTDLLASKVIPVEFGVSDNMAKFAVTANAIEAAIDSTGMIFDVNGLTIKNGSFKIIEEYIDSSDNRIRNEVFYYDDLTHKLHIVGDGTFTGTIYATDGRFTGTVDTDNFNANGGTIGGFKIDANGLYSNDSQSVSDASLKLLSNGQIDAENINLGTGAHINRYIQLGNNAFIWNPLDTDARGKVIEVKDNNNQSIVTLNQNGALQLGQITLDGSTSRIYGNSFSITPTLASFTNISASGKISTVVFEKGHIQSVGGLMMFKPSYKVEDYTNNVLTLDQNFTGSVNDYVYVINEDGGIIGTYYMVSAFNDNEVTLVNPATTPATPFTYSGKIISLIDIGHAVDGQPPLIIGVNSSDVPSSFLRPKGITISEFTLDGTSPNPKVFLGDLDSSQINFADGDTSKKRGFGLYSENVYLTGSLTTKTGNNKFAGVNTLDSAAATKITGDTSKIVFWAGSVTTRLEDVQEAPFQVTENGSIYASQGIFSGAILTNSYIQGADIYAARIHGTGKSENPQKDYGLAFYDTTNGIVFFNGETGGLSTPTEVFSIGNDGFKKNNDHFIEINSGIDFKGNNYRTVSNSSNTENPIGYIRSYESFITGAHKTGENVEVIDTKITFKQQGINFTVSNSQAMAITQSKVEIKATEAQMDNTVLFADKLKYRKVANGYNLFVLS